MCVGEQQQHHMHLQRLNQCPPRSLPLSAPSLCVPEGIDAAEQVTGEVVARLHRQQSCTSTARAAAELQLDEGGLRPGRENVCLLTDR